MAEKPIETFREELIEALTPLLYPMPPEVGRVTGFRTFGRRLVADTESGIVIVLPDWATEDEIQGGGA